nr:type II toxin-antitoxin system PemK/MazF family toxin [Bacilli bacterium]
MKKNITQEEVNEKIRLDLSYINYDNIVKKKLPYKFSYVDEWLLKKSKLLTNEANALENSLNGQKNVQSYRTYGRGTIIKADFGIGIGSEMSQVHFAIVMNNYDNPKNNILTVVPLTSKSNKFNINLSTLIAELFIDKVHKDLEKFDRKDKLTPAEIIKVNKIATLLEYYKTYIKTTYACPSLITTISKERIFPPINEYDIMGKAKCPKDMMKTIDNAINDRFFTQE